MNFKMVFRHVSILLSCSITRKALFGTGNGWFESIEREPKEKNILVLKSNLVYVLHTKLSLLLISD